MWINSASAGTAASSSCIPPTQHCKRRKFLSKCSSTKSSWSATTSASSNKKLTLTKNSPTAKKSRCSNTSLVPTVPSPPSTSFSETRKTNSAAPHPRSNSMNPMFSILATLLVGLAVYAEPLSLHPENPHYFQYRGKPTIIITSAEHYGAVLNLDFDYKKYLRTLAADGMNNTRVFTGSYVEPQGAFNIARNTLAPAENKFIAPWARSSTPGYPNGGNKFDLSKWDKSYFARLKDFMREAEKNGVIVEMNLFCPFYEESQWKLSPQNAANNINNLGNIARTNVYTLDKNGGLLDVHEDLTKKTVYELNEFDNLYYEICNEPYFGGVTLEWQHKIAQFIVEQEKAMPKKHLISRNVANGSAKIDKTHPAVQIYNFHYAYPPDTIAQNFHLNKPIGDNETGFRGTDDLPYRVEAWSFILAGGALYNNLDYSFVAGHE